MTALMVTVFCVAGTALWVSTFGYWLALRFLTGYAPADARPESDPGMEELPPLVVIVPVLNEARFIERRLDDLQQSRYPQGRLRIIVVDGGSTDDTVTRAERYTPERWPVAVMRLKNASGKAEQVSAALRSVDADLVVLTDADTTLDPDCIARLARELVTDDRLAIVGATIVPVTDLAEEKFHWKVINTLWFHEGRVFGASAVSGVCHAMKVAFLRGMMDVHFDAEDIELSMRATQEGYRVRTSSNAIAYEHRVPRSLREMLRFRRDRVGDYRQALVFDGPPIEYTGITRIMRWIRYWQIAAVPVLLVLVVLLGSVLMFTTAWPVAVIAATVFLLSGLTWIRVFPNQPWRWSTLAVFVRWAAVTTAGMLNARAHAPRQRRNARISDNLTVEYVVDE